MAEFRCKYAFDKNDEDCKDCNGISMIEDGKEIKCTECIAYEQGEEIKESPMPAPTETDEKAEAKTKPAKKEKAEPKKTAKKADKEEKQVKTTTETKKAENTPKSTPQGENIDGVSVNSIKFMSGVTLVHKDVYYKISAEEEWKIDPAKVPAEKVQDVREKLWAKVNSEVEKQMDEILSL